MKVYSVEETTKILKTNKNTVYALINKKNVSSVKT